MIIKAPNGLHVAHVEIPRTGSTSIKTALRNNNPRHVPAIEQRKQITHWQHFYTFSTVRHPFERVVAQYLHSPNPEQNWPNFEDWVIARYWNDFRPIPNRENQRLWWPCWKWLSDYHGDLIVSEWLRFEDNPFPYLMEKLGLRSMPHEAKAENRKGDWRYYHTPITRSIIERHAARDFELFYNGG